MFKCSATGAEGRTLAPARPRRCRAGPDARHRPRSIARPQQQPRAQPAARSGPGDERQPDHRAGSKLATAKALDPATAASSLGVELGLGEVDEDELYAALDWLHERQGTIDLARQAPSEGRNARALRRLVEL
jgi:hypothetical protein